MEGKKYYQLFFILHRLPESYNKAESPNVWVIRTFKKQLKPAMDTLANKVHCKYTDNGYQKPNFKPYTLYGKTVKITLKNANDLNTDGLVCPPVKRAMYILWFRMCYGLTFFTRIRRQASGGLLKLKVTFSTA